MNTFYLRKMVEREQGLHPRISVEEAKLSLALNSEGVPHKRQVKIPFDHITGRAGVPYYVVDFLIGPCLIVEVDGRTHQTWGRVRDIERDAVLRQMGYQVIRITNDEVNRDMSGCINRVMGKLRKGVLELGRPSTPDSVIIKR